MLCSKKYFFEDFRYNYFMQKNPYIFIAAARSFLFKLSFQKFFHFFLKFNKNNKKKKKKKKKKYKKICHKILKNNFLDLNYLKNVIH